MAAITPSGIAKHTERTNAPKASSKVAGKRAKKSLAADRFPWMDSPKSNVAALPNQWTYWMRSGLSRPKTFLIWRTSCSVASWGRIILAGSPGAKWRIEKTTMDKTKSVIREQKIRLRKKVITSIPPVECAIAVEG